MYLVGQVRYDRLSICSIFIYQEGVLITTYDFSSSQKIFLSFLITQQFRQTNS